MIRGTAASDRYRVEKAAHCDVTSERNKGSDDTARPLRLVWYETTTQTDQLGGSNCKVDFGGRWLQTRLRGAASKYEGAV